MYQLSHHLKCFQAKVSPGIIHIYRGFIVKHWKYILMYTEHYKKQAKKNILLEITLTCQQEIAEAVIDIKEHPTHPLLLGAEAQEIPLA